MSLRDYSDLIWPTLAPHDSGYAAKRAGSLQARISAARVGCGSDQTRRAKYLEGVRREFEDESKRRESVSATLRALITIASVVAALVVGLAVWLVQSHTLRVTTLSAAIMLAFAAYPVLQFIEALRSVILGLRVRSYRSEPHTASAFGDTMDVAEETLRANHFNEDQTDDSVSYKKVAIRFLLNACVGLFLLVFGIVLVALWNFAAG